MIADHFLDSNIVISSKISWDRYYDHSTKYMAIDNIRRHTSKRVCSESRGVFERGRAVILKYLEEFDKEYMNKKWRFNLVRLYESIDKFTGKFIIKNSIGEKERKIIKNFKERNFEEFKNIILDTSDIGDLKKKVRDSLNSAIDFIDNECRTDQGAKIYIYNNCPSNYNSKEYHDLFKIINYKPDILILLDSHYIKNHHIKNDVYFITTDHEHILDNKTKIESVISGILLIDVENEKFINSCN